MENFLIKEFKTCVENVNILSVSKSSYCFFKCILETNKLCLSCCFFFFFVAQHAPDKLDDFIETINSKLQPMFMQIRKGMSEDNGQQYYALVSGF